MINITTLAMIGTHYNLKLTQYYMSNFVNLKKWYLSNSLNAIDFYIKQYHIPTKNNINSDCAQRKGKNKSYGLSL